MRKGQQRYPKSSYLGHSCPQFLQLPLHHVRHLEKQGWPSLWRERS